MKSMLTSLLMCTALLGAFASSKAFSISDCECAVEADRISALATWDESSTRDGHYILGVPPSAGCNSSYSCLTPPGLVVNTPSISESQGFQEMVATIEWSDFEDAERDDGLIAERDR